MPEQKPVPSRRMSYIVTYVRVELVATTDVQSLLEIPATDKILIEDRNHGLAWTKPSNGHIKHNKQSTDLSVNSFIYHVVPERPQEE